MAQIKPEYEVLDEFTDLAKEILKKYTDQFYGVDLNVIKAVAITNKERPQSSVKLWDLKAVPMPIRMDCKYAYYVILYSEDWDSLEKKHKLLLICQILCAIPIDEDGEVDEGKVKPFDMKDFATMLRTFGTDYLTKDDVPDVLFDQIEWEQ